MNYLKLLLGMLCSTVFATVVDAGAMGSVAPLRSGVYLGIGGAYANSHFHPQTSGSLDAISGFPPLGVFAGGVENQKSKADAFAPGTQAGYFHFFTGSNWLWGLELAYRYANQDSNVSRQGRLVNINSGINVTDVITANHIQHSVHNLFMLPVYLGHSFSNGFAYAGAGPSLLETKDTIGMVQDENSAFYVGEVDMGNNSRWIWGGAVQAGIAYYLNVSWVLRLQYTYAFTGIHNISTLAI